MISLHYFFSGKIYNDDMQMTGHFTVEAMGQRDSFSNLLSGAVNDTASRFGVDPKHVHIENIVKVI